MRTLRQHQMDAVKQLIENKRFLLGHACGTGKTLTALAAAKELNKPVIIVCPQSAKVTWEDENDLGVNIEAMYNYSSFKDLSNKDIRGKILIYDEAHHLSHLDSQRTQQALALTDYDHLFLLSGTCVPDKPIDLFSILVLLRLRENSQQEFYKFRSKYAILKKKMIGWFKTKTGRRMPRYVQEIIAWKNLGQLRQEIEAKASYLKLEQVVDMPPATFIPIYFNLTPKERAEYIVAQEGHLMEELQTCSKFSAERVGDILDSISGEKAVVFSGFLSTIQSLVDNFKGLRLIGETDNREAIVNAFNQEGNELLCTTFHTGAESLNLQAARYTIFTDLPNYLLQFRQALSRTYRTGQNGSVVYYLLIPRNTVVEKVFDRLNRKFNLVKRIFVEEDEDIMSLMKEVRR